MKKTIMRILSCILSVCLIGSNLQMVYAEESKTESDILESDILSEETTLKGIDYPNAAASYQTGPYYRNLLNVRLTGNQREDIVAVANSQVGYMEGGSDKDLSGTSNNHRNYTEYGNYIVGNGGKGWAWCAMFISWCAAKANIDSSIIKSSTTANPNTFGVTYHPRGSYIPQKGDLIFFKYSGSKYNWDHVELVTGVDAANVYAVGGNTGNYCDRVANKKYSLNWSSIKGYGVPNYRTSVPKFTAPTISCENIVSGKGITIFAPGCDAIYYSVDGSGERQYRGRLDYSEGHTIRAYATKAGYQASDVVSYSFSVSKAPVPILTKNEKADGTVVSLSANNPSEQIYYSLDGGDYTQYTNSFTISKTTSIRYYAKLSGYGDSVVGTATIEVSKPNVPTISIKNTSDKIAVGESALLVWSELSNAVGYKLRISKDSELVEEKAVKGISAAYMLRESGTYQFEVKGYNIFGESEYSGSVSVQAMPDVTIQFQDWDGTPLTEKYTIKYGSSVQPPKSPSRLGYDFQNWQGSYTNVTKDTIVTAKYEKKSFYVTFCDQDGTVVSRQRVEWDESAEAPDMSDKAAIGYAFSGWSVDPKESDWVDYTKVEGKMVLYATYAWENENLPVAIRDVSAFCTYNSAGQHYKVDMTLYCTPAKDIRGRIVVEIQTIKGTTVAIGMQDITLEAGNTQITKSVQVNSTADGTIANVYIIGIDEKENTAGAYSKIASTNIEREIFYSEWSDWSTVPVYVTADTQVETKIEYRYNSLLTATSTTSSTMSGYTLVSKTPITGSWSAWQDNPIAAVASNTLNREVEVQNVLVSTTYNYGHYCTGNVAGAQWCTSNSNTTANSAFNANCVYHSLGTFASNDSRLQYSDGDYKYYPNGSKYQCSNYCWRWYRMSTNNVYKPQWRYRDTTYLFKFQKISDWSAWSDTKPAAYNAIEERYVYRYRKVTDANTPAEVDQQETYVVKGTIKGTDSDLSGKIANVMVYKRSNTDPTQNQMEYVDQITIGADNSYEITVMPKEALSELTGDFIVAIAVEGATRLINVDTIYAPKPEYTVTFIADGQVVSEQKVKQNTNAKIPDAPKIAGKEFVRWDTSAANITEDKEIYAVYSEKQYTVVYLDELNGTVEIQKADYNEPIMAEIKDIPAGYDFKGWDAETVTGDMIVRAVYDKAEYTVQFKDVNDKTISTQKVAYGESALPPDIKYITAPSNMQILGWSKDVSWWEVTSDMVVCPIITYESVTDTPYTDTDIELLYVDSDNLLPDGGEEAQTVSLLCDTLDATIYYTLNGDDPIVSEEAVEGTHIYTEPIEVTGDMTIKACSAASGKDISDIFELKIEPDILSMPSEVSENEEIVDEGSGEEVGNGSSGEVNLPLDADKDSVSIAGTSILGNIQAESEGFTVKWAEQKSVTGYQVQYSTNKNFTKQTTKNINKSSITKLTVNKLKARQKYYVRIRTYKTSVGKIQYSSWSQSKSVVTKILVKATSIAGKLKAESKGFTIRWKKQKSVTGYQVQYSTSKSFAKKKTKTKTVKKTSASKLTVGKLKAERKYYVRVRTYKTSGGKRHYSSWSKSKAVIIKK